MASVCCWQLVSPVDTERQRLLVPRLRDWVIWMQMDIAMTCATVGILSGIFGGLFFIKLGTKRAGPNI